MVGIPTDLSSDPSTCGVGYGALRITSAGFGTRRKMTRSLSKFLGSKNLFQRLFTEIQRKFKIK
ncbi:hypothetical protein LEP1GSC086_2629 [Leptospira weilii str. LNT 1234]|nr:hypothetical protein LEP1GSC086_2629 [Leptospira weilii str. LNT 1234]